MEDRLFALRHFPVGASQVPIERLLRLVAAKRTHVVMLVVDVNLAGARVFVERHADRRRPLCDKRFLEPGPRRIEARQKGVRARRGECHRRDRDGWRVSLVLEREPRPRPAPSIAEVPPLPESGGDWPILLAVASSLMTGAVFVVATKGFPRLRWLRVRLSRRWWKRLHPRRRPLVARAHRRRASR